MLNHDNWHLLQLFNGEGASGASAAGDGGSAEVAATGEGSVDAGHQRLRELGVPESKIRKPRAQKASPLPEGAVRTEPKKQEPPQQVAAADNNNAQTENVPSRMSWDEIVKDPEYNAELQKIIKARVKDDGQNKAILETLNPALKHLASQYGLDPENLDHTALAKAITGEYEDMALEMGVSTETAMKLDQQQRTLEQQRMDNHFRSLEQQGEALKATFPNFDLRRELQNETFSRLVSPNMGMSVEDAYHAVHRREIQAAAMQVAAQKTAQQISNAIQSGSRRPDESGVTAQAPSVTTFDYTKMNRAEREALKKRIYSGERILPGQV